MGLTYSGTWKASSQTAVANSQIDADRRKIYFPSKKVSGVNLLCLHSVVITLALLIQGQKQFLFFQAHKKVKGSKLWKPTEQNLNTGKSFSVFFFFLFSHTTHQICELEEWVWVFGWQEIIPSACLLGCIGRLVVVVCVCVCVCICCTVWESLLDACVLVRFKLLNKQWRSQQIRNLFNAVKLCLMLLQS